MNELVKRRRIAVIFDHHVRPDTTGIYCRRALSMLANVTHIQPQELGDVDPREFDLYLNVDDGLRYRLPAELRPCVWWAIDTHMDFAWYAEKARDFDYVFAAQLDGSSKLKDLGLPAIWLPLACDPAIHGQRDVRKRFDVAFVGHVADGPRAELLHAIEQNFPNTVIGQCHFEDMAETYSASRIVFNRSVRNDVNMRVFEGLASGALLVTNDLAENGQNELFLNETHLVTYRERDELVDKIEFYLRHDGLRKRIAAAGQNAVISNHTYLHRMTAILDTILAGPEREQAAVAPVHKGPLQAGGATVKTPDLIVGTSIDSDANHVGVTSIVIVTHNQLSYTQLCLESIAAATSEPYELIVVDNGSTDDTPAYLRSRTDVRFIANHDNRGFPAACNQGIRAARGHHVVLLNNDTLVTDGWLGACFACCTRVMMRTSDWSAPFPMP